MVERDEVASLERRLREPAGSSSDTLRERAELERTITASRDALEAARNELPTTENAAKERRRQQSEALRGRAELERRHSELLEAESMARTRRQQAEQRAQSFLAAAAFASAARSEADDANDGVRAERERLVEDRATRESTAADTRAHQERAEEIRIGKLRHEVAGHVAAEREIEAAIGSERADLDRRVSEIRDRMDRASFALRESEVALLRLDAERERLTSERIGADLTLREASHHAREEVEQRISVLRAAETNITRERADQERLLATLVEQDGHAHAEHGSAAREAVAPEAATRAALAHEVELRATMATPQPPPPQAVAPPEEVAPNLADAHAAHLNGNGHATIEPLAPPAQATQEFVVDEDALAQDEPPGIDMPSPHANGNVRSALDEELIPGFRSFIGNIFKRAKNLKSTASVVEEEAESPPESTSIAERIARDFGLLGTSNDAASPPFEVRPVAEEATPPGHGPL